jgi:hypothetical protein
MAHNRKAVSFAFPGTSPTSLASGCTPRLLPGYADSDSRESKLLSLSSKRKRVSFVGSERLGMSSPRSMATKE